MDFLRFLGSVPNRFLAILLGVTVLPLFSIMYLLNALLLSAFLAVGLIFVGFFSVSSSLEELSVPGFFNILITVFISTPIIVVLSAIAFVAFASYLMIRAAFNSLGNMYTGFSSGLLKGLDGFFQALSELRSPFELLNLQLSTLNNRIRVERNDVVRFNDFEQIIAELEDVKVTETIHEVPDLEYKEEHKTEGSLLNNTEIDVANALICSFSNCSIPLDHTIKAQVELLKTRLNHYNDLSTRLNKVAEQIRDNKIGEIDDEVISYNEVKTPIFLFKQYQEQQQWHSVPAHGYVTNKESLLKWLAINPIHPLNNDKIEEPSKYDGKPTRYRWYQLTNQYYSAQELIEAAMEIRKLLESLPLQLEKVITNKIDQSSSIFAFYSQQHSSEEGSISNNRISNLPTQ